MSKIFNDTVYGRIEIPDYCIRIIDTPEFQRLRGLKQLGLTSYVFHNASHTRFEHSIGVCYLAGEWIKHLQKTSSNISDSDIRIVQLSALLHDIGHGPFSHTFEKFIKKTRPKLSNYCHEQMTISIVKEIDVDLLNKFDKEKICNIIEGKLLDSKPFLGQIVNNTINGLDSDKLDYFMRDSQCTSFAIACDWKRIIYESRIIDNEIVFPYKMIGDIFNLYQTRFRLYKEVYYHKTVCKIEDILIDALILADKLGIFKFYDSIGVPKSLSKSIDDTKSFLLTQDDIIGQMERSGDIDLLRVLNKITKRTFKNVEIHTTQIHNAHYGMKEKNPLLYVKFIDKNGIVKQINQKIIDTMCPREFSLGC